MRKTTRLIVMVACACMASSALFAGGVNYNVNQSAEWCKTMNLYATLDADSTYYNPGGTALLGEGFYMQLNNQTVYQPIKVVATNYSMGYSLRKTYNGEKHAWYFPTGYLALKKDRWAISGGAFAIGGGGDANFKDGLQQMDVLLNPTVGLGKTINSLYTSLGMGTPIGTIATNGVYQPSVKSSFKGSSSIYAIQVNAAYEAIKDVLGISIGYRLHIWDATADAHLYTPGAGATYFGLIPMASDFHAHQSGTSHAIILGISAKPVKDLTIGVKGEYNTIFPVHVKSHDDQIVGLVDSGYKNNGRKHAQLPANIAAGISYKIEGLQIAATFAYFFNQFAQLKGVEKGYTGGWDAGLGLDYTIKGTPLNIGIGYLYGFSGVRPTSQSQLNEDLNTHSGSIGFTFNFNEDIKLTLAEQYAYYVPTNVNKAGMGALRYLPAKFYKQSFNTAIGVTSKFKI